MNPLYIAIDFDGTLTRHETKEGARPKYPEIGIENDGAVYWLKHLIALPNVHATLLTMREDDPLKLAIDWCLQRELRFDWINESFPAHFTHPVGRKIYYDILVDDLAFGCPLIHFRGRRRPCVDWERVGPALLKSAKDGHSWRM